MRLSYRGVWESNLANLFKVGGVNRLAILTNFWRWDRQTVA